MTPYNVILTSEAQSDVKNLNVSVQIRVLNKLEWIGENAEYVRHQALQGDEWAGCYKYRVGDYRVIYQLDRSRRKLTVLKIGHRRDIYR